MATGTLLLILKPVIVSLVSFLLGLVIPSPIQKK